MDGWKGKKDKRGGMTGTYFLTRIKFSRWVKTECGGGKGSECVASDR